MGGEMLVLFVYPQIPQPEENFIFRSLFESVLGLFGPMLRYISAHLEPFWTFWGLFGPFGASWGLFWSHFGSLGTWGLFSAQFGPLGAYFGPFLNPSLWPFGHLASNDAGSLHLVSFLHFLDRLKAENYPLIQYDWSPDQFRVLFSVKPIRQRCVAKYWIS